MGAAKSIRSPLRAATCQTLIGLLAVTGMRAGEVIGLDRGDVDLDGHVLTIRDGKSGSRRLLLSASIRPAPLRNRSWECQCTQLLCAQAQTRERRGD
jgi:integrase